MPFGLYDLLWYFILYSLLGWCVEVVFCTVTTGKLVNRGFLNGPVCPIYGFGMVLVLGALGRFVDQPFVLFLGGMVLTSSVELVGGWALKKFFHTSWWDYSDQPFNIGGYVCLKFSLAWGLCVVFVLRVVHPALSTLIGWIPFTLGVVLLIVILLYFIADTVVTVMTICKLNRNLNVLNTMAAELRRESDAISSGLGKLVLAADERLAEQKQEILEKTAAERAALEEQLKKRNEKREQLQQSAAAQREAWIQQTTRWQRRMQGRLLRAFPDMHNHVDNDALQRVRMWMEEKHK